MTDSVSQGSAAGSMKTRRDSRVFLAWAVLVASLTGLGFGLFDPTGFVPRLAIVGACLGFAAVGFVVGYVSATSGGRGEREAGPIQVSPTVVVPEPKVEVDLSVLVPLLERIAVAVERAPAAPQVIAVPQFSPADVRLAIAERAWERVDTILAENPEHPDREKLAEELRIAKEVAVAELKDELVAAREVKDPERVLGLYDELVKLIDQAEVKQLRQDSVRWFINLIMKRMRTGTVRVDVADLAGRVADRFGSTVEGASLKASLPTLRRSAGLCPQCGKPYAGLADACPECQMAAVAAGAPVRPSVAEPEESSGEEGQEA